MIDLVLATHRVAYGWKGTLKDSWSVGQVFRDPVSSGVTVLSTAPSNPLIL